MKKYHYHPDNIIIITNEDKVYIEKPSLAKFDLQKDIIYPIESSTEFQYIMGYGTRNFNMGDMISFSDQPRTDLDEIINNVDLLIQRKQKREIVDNSVWEIPEDMRVYTPTTTTIEPEIETTTTTTTEAPNVN